MSKRTQNKLPADADAWGLELFTERSGLFFYRYRRLRLERTGRRAAVREFNLQIDYDTKGAPITKPRQLVRQRGRSLPVEECERLWTAIAELRPYKIDDQQRCLDDTLPGELDQSVGPCGTPIAVLTGEEGPACLTLRPGRPGEREVKRVVIERFREPGPIRASRKTPLASIVSLIEPGVRAEAPFNYRRSKPLLDLTAEFQALKALNFLNLRDFERRSLQALGALRDPAAVPFLSEELFAPDPQVRLQALNALASIGNGGAAREVELLYYDEDPEVRERAREVLDLLLNRV